jgi:predicted NBD/HSP70 family sugar kinase
VASEDRERSEATILGVDIGGTKTALLAVTAEAGRTVAATTVPTPRDSDPRAFVAFLRHESDAMLQGAGADPLHVRAVGCAVPGQVDADGLVLGAGNLQGWSRAPLRRLLEEQWRTPAFVEQDANAGALGEMWLGVARAMSDFVFVALGTGVGAGIVLDRRIHRGAHHAAGEIGDLLVERHSLGHAVRGKDNLSARVGSPAVRARMRAATGTEMSAAEAVSAMSPGGGLAPVARDVASDLAMAVIAIAALIDPEAVVFGGGTAAESETLLAAVRDHVSRALWRPPSLVLAALGERSQLYGVIAGAMDRLAPHGRIPAHPGAA